MEHLLTLREEVKEELLRHIIPFWKNLRDDEWGGYYGWLSYDLSLDKKSEKGCILNSRITWFFSNAYTLLKEESLLDEAKHGYAFLKQHCVDRENGGVYWSLNYDGTPLDTTKHTYNQAFSIYALSSYYEAAKEKEALELAYALYRLIETKCRDEVGYLEAFTKDFKPESNEKLSENGVMADKTMNTLLHVFEAYTELYRVCKANETLDLQAENRSVVSAGYVAEQVKQRLHWILDLIAEKIYNPKKQRQEVFFDKNYHTILDLHSYGHDIETAWLVDRGVELLGEETYREKMTPITQALTAQVYQVAFDGHSLANECDRGVVNENRVWWVQAETLVGFLNAYQKDPSHSEYRDAAHAEWEFIKEYVVDRRNGSEWYWEVQKDGSPITTRPIVEPWKCPYHNGRMCFEVMKRIKA